jgi:D-serine deaminase-like pyridoxal phosphate-dependent protein
MTIHDVDTPALLIDLDVLQRNLRRMADYCQDHKLAFRPHTKTHKIPEIAQLQLGCGAAGITVAKLGEAEVMADRGMQDILIVYPLWGDKKWTRLVELAARVRVTVAVDSLAVACGISRAVHAAGVEVGIRAEFDTGFHRCGWPLTLTAMDDLHKIQALPGLRWDGILLYPGHIMGSRSTREEEIRRENQQIDRLLELLDAASIPHPVVSGGNTPAAFLSHHFHAVNEIRPGTYVFNDRNTVDAESAEFADCALSVLTTVVSKGSAKRAIIDSGSKTLSEDPLLSGSQQGHGYVIEYPDIQLQCLSEEHGHLWLPDNCPIKIGERLRVIPNHVCSCVNLHEYVFVIQREQVLEQWKVAARGKVV